MGDLTPDAAVAAKMEKLKRNPFAPASKVDAKLSEEQPADDTPLQSFLVPDSLSNVVLEVENTDLHVHKEVLASWSPVFMAMFTGDFLESRANRVTLDGKKIDDVRLLLNIIYPPNTQTVTNENVLQILPLADEYRIESLKTKCESILQTFEPDLRLLAYGHLYNMPRLVERSIKGCTTRPVASLDLHKLRDVETSIPADLMLQVYWEKMMSMKDKIKSLTAEVESSQRTKSSICNWGVNANSYPCERHVRFVEAQQCLACLSAFREHALALLKNDKATGKPYRVN